VADPNELSDEDMASLATRAVWKGLKPEVREAIAAHLTPEDKKQIGKGLLNAQQILDRQRRNRG
jgi:hypothetical protein